MAITWIANASLGAPNAGAITLTLPTGSMTVDDLIIVTHGDGDTTDNTLAMTTAGYTIAGAEQYANASANDTNHAVHYKYWNGTDTNVVIAGTGGGTNCGASACFQIFRGVATVAQGGPFSTAPVQATGVDSTSANPPSISTTGAGAVVICGSCAKGTTGTATAPTNYTTNANAGSQGTDTIDGTSAMAHRLSGFADPEDPGVFTFSGGSAAGDSWAATTLALMEAPVLLSPVRTYVLFGPAMRRASWW